MLLSKDKIAIEWPEDADLSTSGLQVTWNKSNLAVTTASPWDDASERLFGTSVVGRLLNAAFERGLTRKHVWIAEDLSAEEFKSLDQAARIFKRGVSCKAGNSAPRQITNHAGRSSIEFFESVKELLSRISSKDTVVVDKNVHAAWRDELPAASVVFAVAEDTKDLNAVAALSQLIPKSASRLVVVGGGVLGDIAGFVAALRGITTVYIPTTLLSMADSSVGGKTGVSAGVWGKNQIGMFHSPAEVWIWAGWLKTLPERELKSGMVECVKHALLSGDRDLWHDLLKIAKERQWPSVASHLMRVVVFKAAVVEADPFEHGERAILNFGHTMGHAVESLSLKVDGKDALTHGEAVAIGLCHELQLSKQHAGFADAAIYSHDLVTSGLVPELTPLFLKQRAELRSFLLSDKKNSDGNIHWVLLRKFGDVARTAKGDWTIPLSDLVSQNLLVKE